MYVHWTRGPSRPWITRPSCMPRTADGVSPALDPTARIPMRWALAVRTSSLGMASCVPARPGFKGGSAVRAKCRRCPPDPWNVVQNSRPSDCTRRPRSIPRASPSPAVRDFGVLPLRALYNGGIPRLPAERNFSVTSFEFGWKSTRGRAPASREARVSRAPFSRSLSCQDF